MSKSNYCLTNEKTIAHCSRCRRFDYVDDKTLTMEQIETATRNGEVHYHTCAECAAKDPILSYCPSCDNYESADLEALTDREIEQAERNGDEIIGICFHCQESAAQRAADSRPYHPVFPTWTL